MLFKKTLLVLMCSSALVACGGGGSSNDSSNGSGSDGGSVTTPASDLDKAKQLIETTKAIISYYDGFQDIADNYKTPVEVINNTASDLSRGADIILTLAELAQEDSKGQTKQYNGAELELLLKNDAINNDYPLGYDLKNNTLQIQVSADSVKVTGSADVAYWDAFKEPNSWDWGNPDWYTDKNNFVYANQAKVNVTNLLIEAPFVASQSTYNFKIANGGSIEVTNAVNKKAKFSFTADSTAKLVHPVVATLENQETEPTQASLVLKGLIFESGDVKATLSEVSFDAKAVKFSNGQLTSEQLIPYQLTLKGQVAYLQEVLDLDASIKLNNDLSKVIDISKGETSLNFINADLAVKLSGKLKGANAAPTPFSINVTAKRAEYLKGIANVAVAVDKNALEIAFESLDITVEEPVVDSLIKHNNGAFVQIKDIKNFKQADVKVGTTSYGTITKTSSGQYAVKFTDNTFVYITP
ncbi:hypothetical protein CDG60_03940 [Acinetobacter chinensis]|uniref:Uncharacterized protein n=1 Tax=Acinetobacter chinensis TaxID=2004650 RepID=A0A3B7LV38_9GAMM|nr:hypothetical protein [Acinetobacter chinensis]AXY55814.1 hypothetical protein CDG60_03940 [Acinetobacter chinensis]